MADNKKQIPLRISESLYLELARWADDEFRSVNGQIEYLLTECVKKRRKSGTFPLSLSYICLFFPELLFFIRFQDLIVSL